MNEIFVKDTSNGRLLPLTDWDDSMSDISPSWSPDGSQIVFVSDDLADNSRDIWVMNADGSGRRRLTTNSLQEGTVVWSPDGSKIAFDDVSSPSDIWVMNSNGTNLKSLTNTGEPLILEREPTWSPDGSKIAFVRNPWDSGGQDIWVMDSDGSDKKNLTNTPAPSDLIETSPSWSPNGRKIAFVMDNSQTGAPTVNTDVWKMDADGTDQRNITDTSEFEFAPDWQPSRPTGTSGLQ
jgi:TolB protein